MLKQWEIEDSIVKQVFVFCMQLMQLIGHAARLLYICCFITKILTCYKYFEVLQKVMWTLQR